MGKFFIFTKNTLPCIVNSYNFSQYIFAYYFRKAVILYYQSELLYRPNVISNSLFLGLEILITNEFGYYGVIQTSESVDIPDYNK
jgi:hypothetical protein